jgi:hypothetical protein
MSSQSQPSRTSRRWWILALVLSIPVILVVGLYALTVVGFSLADVGGRTVGDAQTTAQRYYSALQQHDYPSAFSYLQHNAVVTVGGQDVTVDSAQTLSAAAQQAEQSDGAILTEVGTDGNFEVGKQIVDLTVHVTRASRAYDVHLQVDLTTQAGKILHADGL